METLEKMLAKERRELEICLDKIRQDQIEIGKILEVRYGNYQRTDQLSYGSRALPAHSGRGDIN